MLNWPGLIPCRDRISTFDNERKAPDEKIDDSFRLNPASIPSYHGVPGSWLPSASGESPALSTPPTSLFQQSASSTADTLQSQASTHQSGTRRESPKYATSRLTLSSQTHTTSSQNTTTFSPPSNSLSSGPSTPRSPFSTDSETQQSLSHLLKQSSDRRTHVHAALGLNKAERAPRRKLQDSETPTSKPNINSQRIQEHGDHGWGKWKQYPCCSSQCLAQYVDFSGVASMRLSTYYEAGVPTTRDFQFRKRVNTARLARDTNTNSWHFTLPALGGGRVKVCTKAWQAAEGMSNRTLEKVLREARSDEDNIIDERTYAR